MKSWSRSRVASDRRGGTLEKGGLRRREGLGVQVGTDLRGTRLAQTADLAQLLARLLAQLLTPCYRGRDLLVDLARALEDRCVGLRVAAAIDIAAADLRAVATQILNEKDRRRVLIIDLLVLAPTLRLRIRKRMAVSRRHLIGAHPEVPVEVRRHVGATPGDDLAASAADLIEPGLVLVPLGAGKNGVNLRVLFLHFDRADLVLDVLRFHFPTSIQIVRRSTSRDSVPCDGRLVMPRSARRSIPTFPMSASHSGAIPRSESAMPFAVLSVPVLTPAPA